jgi:hypothetical protein
MKYSAQEERPKWPDSLPPPIEIVEKRRYVPFTEADLNGDSSIQDLVHDLYWFIDSDYYLYFEYGKGIENSLLSRLGQAGVEMNRTEMYFFCRPNPSYKNDFIRILPHSEVPKWQEEAFKGKMFCRVSLTLESARRKQLDFSESGRLTNELLADKEPMVEAKPNFYGFGLNLNSIWHRVKCS